MQIEQNEQTNTTQRDEVCAWCEAPGEVGCHGLEQGTVVSAVYCNSCWTSLKRGTLK